MRTPAVVAFVLVFLVANVACHREAAHPAAPKPAPQEVPSFDADKVDITFDWDSTPIGGRPKGDSPIKLTASDGTGLQLMSLEARAVLYGPLAFTELHLAFDNNQPRTREGTFSIQLPEGAAVSRFAMKVGYNWQEGEVVEREAARATYETFVHRKVDPAMLVRDSGNVFRGRVFPIFSGQRKEIILSYSHELPRVDQPYRLALRGLPQLARLDVQLLVPSQKKAFVVRRMNVAPEHDFEWTPAKRTGDAVRGGRWAVVRSVPPAAETAQSPLDSVAVLVDASASRGSAYADSVDKMDRVVAMLGAKTVKVATFDQDVEPMPSLAAAKQRKPAGASNLRAALAWAATAGVRRAVLMTDGIPSAGGLTAADLASSVAALRAAGVERVDAIAVGARRDEALLRAVAHAGTVVDGEATAHEAIARDLLHAPRATSELTFSEVDPGSPLRDAEDAPAPLVERAVALARIRELEKRPDRQAVRNEIIALSTKHRVLSDYTAMLVLETDADYERFNIKRDALTDILMVGSRGVVAAHREDAVLFQSNNGISPILDPRPPSTIQVDTDHDGILDSDDKCPNEPETLNGFDDEDGCPDKSRVILDSNRIVILQTIRFRTDSNEILPESMPVLDAIAEAITHHPEFTLIEIAGHTDDRGDDGTNLRRSQARAETVVKALVDRGVEKGRLRAQGYGEWCPLELGHGDEARDKNRRVEAKIVATKDGPTGISLGCENATYRGKRPIRVEPALPPRPVVAEPLSGPSAEIASLLAAKKKEAALKSADEWTTRAPDDMLAWLAEGRALEALGRPRDAARAYGSLLDLARKPEHRRAAAGFLESVAAKWPPALELAIEVYRRAALERPEQPSSHRLLAYALAKGGELDAALETTLAALSRTFDERRTPGASDLLRTDAALFAAAIVRTRPTDRGALEAKLGKVNAKIATAPATQVVLTWETDESDLDLLTDSDKLVTHAPQLGFGPESFLLENAARVPLELKVRQVRRGPQGFAMGKVAILRHDGSGKLVFDDRPFLIMNENATLPLGTIER